MISPDNGLRPLFRKHIPAWQWTSIESGTTAGGIPDSEFMSTVGVSGWVEYKFTKNWKPVFKTLQIGWIYRRAHMGGRVFVAVRRTPATKRDLGEDQLWLVPGIQVRRLATEGLYNTDWVTNGGPENWDWNQVRSILTT